MQLIGKLTLNRNPTNYFAETEQVAFHTGNLVPGIEVTNDPLMQARLFSYLDTQLTRLGGPELRPAADQPPALPGQRHAARRHAPDRDPHRRSPPYRPNSIDGGEPMLADEERRRLRADAAADRGNGDAFGSPASFDDHFSQATMFYRSLSAIEQAHIVEAFTFELGKVYEQAIKERELAGTGQRRRRPVRAGGRRSRVARPEGQTRRRRRRLADLGRRFVAEPGRIAGRKIGVIADAGSDLAGIAKLVKATAALGVTALVIAPVGGLLKSGRRTVTVDRTLATARSIEFDALVVAGGTTPTRRHQARRAAARGLPALQGDRRLG